ncbi:MAG: hypothetical protein ACRCXA_14545 [Peptostreptococcaceae bacterium]
MYSKNKVITMAVIALVVLGIGIVKEGIMGRNAKEASYLASQDVYADNESKDIHNNGCRGKGKCIFESTLNELKESGVLTEEDIKNIQKYRQEERQAMMKEISHERVDKMVKDNVITSEKGQQLKDALDKKIK